MTDRKVRIAQVGITSHGETILSAIIGSTTLKLVSVYDVKEEDVRNVAEKTSARPASSYEEIVGDPSVDAIALVTPNHLHAAQVQAAVEAGKHIFVEKPITKTVAEAKHVIGLAVGANRVLMTGHNTRRRPIFRHAKKILDEQRLGTVVGIEANMSRPVGIREGLPQWKSDAKTANLVSMTQLGIHFVDAIHYLIGPVARVGCFAANTAMPGGSFDAASAILELESGLPVTLSAYYVTPDVYYFRIYGTKGILHCHLTGYSLEILDGQTLRKEEAREFPNEGFASYEEQMEEFGKCILEGKKPETGGEEGLQALAVIEAMTRSINTGHIVEIKEVLES